MCPLGGGDSGGGQVLTVQIAFDTKGIPSALVVLPQVQLRQQRERPRRERRRQRRDALRADLVRVELEDADGAAGARREGGRQLRHPAARELVQPQVQQRELRRVPRAEYAREARGGRVVEPRGLQRERAEVRAGAALKRLGCGCGGAVGFLVWLSRVYVCVM